MADPENSGKPTPPGGEISVERRMLLAFGLVGLVLVLSQFLFSPSAPSKSGPTETKPATREQAAAPKPAVDTPAVKPAKADAAVVTGEKSETYTIDTKVYRIVFSNHGAVARSWTLKDYKDTEAKPLELVNAAAAQKTHYPLSFLFEAQKPAKDLNQVLYAATMSPDGLGITFDYSDGKTIAR